MNRDKMLEVCVDSLESALAAKRGGADRFELCSNIVIGGTTPSPFLFEAVREQTDTKVHVLLRPRCGDFCYSESEFEILKKETQYFSKAKADGIVIGMLTPQGDLDAERMKRLIESAGAVPVTLHRAFDVCRDPYDALEAAVNLGIATILTAGQKNHCVEGRTLLAELYERAQGRIDIMAGAGVDADAVEKIAPSGIRSYHMSGKRTCDSRMQYRKEGVSMGISGMDEYGIYQTDEQAVRSVRTVLDMLD